MDLREGERKIQNSGFGIADAIHQSNRFYQEAEVESMAAISRNYGGGRPI